MMGVNWPYGTTADWARGATACDVVMDMPLVLGLLPKCEELATFCHLQDNILWDTSVLVFCFAGSSICHLPSNSVLNHPLITCFAPNVLS